jgi:hypothetical protein
LADGYAAGGNADVTLDLPVNVQRPYPANLAAETRPLADLTEFDIRSVVAMIYMICSS